MSYLLFVFFREAYEFLAGKMRVDLGKSLRSQLVAFQQTAQIPTRRLIRNRVILAQLGNRRMGAVS